MPTPRPDETESEFMSRRIPQVLDEGTAEDADQAAAICYSFWKNRSKDMALQYAYTLLDTKAFDEDSDKVVIKGVASTPTPDRSRDIVDPLGAKFKTPMPLLWMHSSNKPVGTLNFAKPSKDGIPFEAEIPRVKEEGKLKERIDEAIHSLKYKLVTAVSIGFNALEYNFMDDGGIHFKEWEWLELSLVTIPANPDAKIELVKSIDRDTLAALGKERQSREHLKTGVSGKHFKPIQLIRRSTK